MYPGYQAKPTQFQSPSGEMWKPIPGKGTPGVYKGPRKYKPSKQEFILSRTEKELLVGGSRGGIKTETGLAWGSHPKYIKNPRFMGLVLRKNYEDLSNWIKRAKYFYDGLGTIVGKPAEIRWNDGGTTRLGHWKDADTIAHLIGHEYHKINCEELTQSVASYKEYQMILSCCRSSVAGLDAQFYASTNPGGVGHSWVMDYFVKKANMHPYYDEKSKSWRLFVPTTILDNPILMKNDPAYYHYLNNLPEPLRSAWFLGDWDIIIGQFFSMFNEDMRVSPWKIGDLASDKLFGSLDTGLGDGKGGGSHTSFGLNYKSPDGHVERLFTYREDGHDHRWHAEAIFEKIDNFRNWTNGYFPLKVYTDPSAWRQNRIADGDHAAPIDVYWDVFKGKCTEFVKANNNKDHGCGIMREFFSFDRGHPKFVYWDHYNDKFENGIANVVTDDTNLEIYKKAKGDDIADECRYGLVGVNGEIVEEQQRKMNGNKNDVTRIEIDDYYNDFNFQETSLV